MRRRDFLGAGAALAAMVGLPSVAAAAGAADRRFLFVFANGGWDPTRALSPGWGTAAAMEPDAVAAEIGGLPFVDHPGRPSVRAFFEANAQRSVIVEGVLVPSVAHDACTRILMTGSADDGRPDWPAILGSAAPEHLLPHLVTGGPSFPGPLGSVVARTGLYGQLNDLVQGRNSSSLSDASSDAIDRLLRKRADARLQRTRATSEHEIVEAYRASVGQLQDLRDLDRMDVQPFLDSQLELALDMLASGTSRCVTVQADGSFDTHTNNDTGQGFLWEDLFESLTGLAGSLSERIGPRGVPLIEDTMVVVLSEMGRTPVLNDAGGKDHWPYTSALLFGAWLVGGQVVGGYDASFEGRLIDPASGQPTEGGRELSAGVFGATLVAAADVDPGAWLPGASPITGILR